MTWAVYKFQFPQFFGGSENPLARLQTAYNDCMYMFEPEIWMFVDDIFCSSKLHGKYHFNVCSTKKLYELVVCYSFFVIYFVTLNGPLIFAIAVDNSAFVVAIHRNYEFLCLSLKRPLRFSENVALHSVSSESRIESPLTFTWKYLEKITIKIISTFNRFWEIFHLDGKIWTLECS